MNRFSISPLPLAGLMRITRERLGDSRGFLSRLFCAQELAAAGWTLPVAQINQTQTIHCGTVRGLHFQHPPHAEMKLVSCLRGTVWDAVSYTHLDVYKRQCPMSHLIWQPTEWKCMNATPNLGA